MVVAADDCGFAVYQNSSFQKGNVMLDDTPLVKRAYNLGLKIVPNLLSLTAEQIAYYENHLSEIPDALARGFIVPPKFVVLKDFGTITVPMGYVHSTYLKSFTKRWGDKLYYFNTDITDKNFKSPSRILKPGEKLRVRAFSQNVAGTTTSIERIDFLKTQNALFVGAQGLGLLFEQKRGEVAKDKVYVSFDEEANLPVVGGHCGVPCFFASSDGSFKFTIAHFGPEWDANRVLLCFSDETSEA